MFGRGGDWRGPPMPAQLSFRVAVLGGTAIVMFVIIFLRLWYLGVLSGDEYLAEAQNNQVREFTVQAPRGEILDREGRRLVQNRTALELQVRTTDLPASKERRRRLFDRLGEVTGMKPAEIRKEIRKQERLVPGSPVTLQRDVPFDVVYYLRENAKRFPGVSVERVYVRRYPLGTTAAHVVGYVREVSEEDLEDPRYETLDQGDFIGQEGVESTYDSLLRGVNGASRLQVDAAGIPTGRTLDVRDPRVGNDLVLTIDSKVQQAGEAAIAGTGLRSGFIAMKVRSGEILGIGSHPTYDPGVFAKPTVPQSTYESIFGNPDDLESQLAAPAINRASQGAYPAGSTFKPITALAALDAGKLTLNETIEDGGAITLSGQEFTNAGSQPHGTVDLRRALEVSSDVFFYIMGSRTNVAEGAGGKLQEWSQALGFGELSGLDISESEGRLPTPEQRNEAYEANTSPDSACGKDICLDKGEVTDRRWSVGDNIQLAIGQGDLVTNPLQMAVAYAAIANGGDVVRPHVGLRVEDPDGRAIQEIDPAPRRHIDIDPAWRQTIMTGLRDAAMNPEGTSSKVFGGYPIEIAGKTGTAERAGYADQSWYVALAPAQNPRYVVAVTAEEGGFGADTAAPVTQQILNELLKVNEAKIEEAPSAPAVIE